MCSPLAHELFVYPAAHTAEGCRCCCWWHKWWLRHWGCCCCCWGCGCCCRYIGAITFRHSMHHFTVSSSAAEATAASVYHPKQVQPYTSWVLMIEASSTKTGSQYCSVYQPASRLYFTVAFSNVSCFVLVKSLHMSRIGLLRILKWRP